MPYRTPTKINYSSKRDKLIEALLNVPIDRINNKDIFNFTKVRHIEYYDGYYRCMWCINQFALDLSFFSPSIGLLVEMKDNKQHYKLEYLFKLTRKERKAFKKLIQQRKEFLNRKKIIKNEYLLSENIEEFLDKINNFKQLKDG